jgi:hypothetical protein
MIRWTKSHAPTFGLAQELGLGLEREQTKTTSVYHLNKNRGMIR